MEEESLAILLRMDLDPSQAVREASEELQAARSAGDKHAQLRAWRLLAVAHSELGDMTALAADIAGGERLARDLGHVEAQGAFLAAQAILDRNAARYARSNALFEQAIALAQRHGRERMLAQLYLDQSYTPLEEGRKADTIAMLLKAQAIFEKRQDRFGQAITLDAMGAAIQLAPASEADRTRGIEYHLQALAMLDPSINRASVLTIHYNLGVAHYVHGDRVRSRRHLEKGLDMARRHEGPISAAYYEFNLAKISRDEGRHKETLAHLAQALPHFKSRGDLIMMAFATLMTRADTLARMGRESDTLAALAEARVMLPQLNSAGREARFHEASAGMLARFGHYEKAYQEMRLAALAERRRMEAANDALAADLKTQFEFKQKESENAVLRARHEQADARRLMLLFALVSCLVLIMAGAVYLRHQVRRSRRYATLAMRDDLTGLPNRRSIGEFARLQWAARSAHEGRLRVALLDIDHFKRINDEFGHDVGDEVLAGFAKACAGVVRGSDRLGRYGGEEFLLVMPGSEAGFTPQLFQRLQQAVRDLRLPGLPEDRRITFSMGVAEALGEHDSLEALIQRADKALYRAKAGGRDRFESASPVRRVA